MRWVQCKQGRRSLPCRLKDGPGRAACADWRLWSGAAGATAHRSARSLAPQVLSHCKGSARSTHGRALLLHTHTQTHISCWSRSTQKKHTLCVDRKRRTIERTQSNGEQRGRQRPHGSRQQLAAGAERQQRHAAPRVLVDERRLGRLWRRSHHRAAGKTGARRLGQQAAVFPQHHRLLGGSGKYLALSLPMPAEWRRWVLFELTVYVCKQNMHVLIRRKRKKGRRGNRCRGAGRAEGGRAGGHRSPPPPRTQTLAQLAPAQTYPPIFAIYVCHWQVECAAYLAVLLSLRSGLGGLGYRRRSHRGRKWS